MASQLKKTSHKTCRDLESALETLADVKANRGKPMSEKDVAKLEKNCRKLEEALVKSDRDYRDSNMKTEEARLAWEASMYRCCQVSGGSRRHKILSEELFSCLSLWYARLWKPWSWRGASKCS